MAAPASATAATDRFTPVEFLVSGARRFSSVTGSPAPSIDYWTIRLDPALGARISDAYIAGPAWDARALPAYEALRRETVRQFRFLTAGTGTGGLGVTVEVVDFDPYQNGKSIADDLLERRLKIYSSAASGNPHPFLTDQENDMFRAVHDAFGHAATGCGFDRDGEEAAWLKHHFMFSKPARMALATETRGQSCAQSFHFEGRRFPEQKLMLLPERYCSPPPLPHGGSSAPRLDQQRDDVDFVRS